MVEFASHVLPDTGTDTDWGDTGSGSETDSGGTSTDVAIMLSGGEVNYASPPSTAGAWGGSPGPYSNVPALWFDGTY